MANVAQSVSFTYTYILVNIHISGRLNWPSKYIVATIGNATAEYYLAMIRQDHIGNDTVMI